MRILGKIIAFLILIILLIILPVSILVYDVGRVVFDQALVKGIVTDVATESDLIPAALSWFSFQRAEQRYGEGKIIAWEDEPDIIDLLSMVSDEGWQTMRAEVLPNEILAEWISGGVDDIYEWIDSDQQLPDVSFDLRSFKDRVSSEHGENAIQVVYDTLSPCTEGEVADYKTRLAGSLGGEEVPYNLCQFSGAFGEDQLSDYHNSLVLVVNQIPDTFTLTDDIPGLGLGIIKTQLLMVRLLMRLSPFLPVVLLVLILAFAVRSLAELARWWGIPLVVDGMLLLGLTLLNQTLLAAALTLGPLRDVTPFLREEALTASTILANEVFRPLLWQSIVIAGLGVLLFLVGMFVRPKPPAPVKKTLPVVE